MAVMEFDIVVQDLVAFNMHAARTRPGIRTRSWSTRLLVTALSAVAGIAAVLLQAPGNVVDAAVVGLIAAGVMWFAWPPYYAWITQRQFRRMAAQGRLGTPGRVRVWTDDSGFHEQTPATTLTIAWTDTFRVDETPTHAFVWFWGHYAVVIPKRAGADAVAALLADLRRRSVGH